MRAITQDLVDRVWREMTGYPPGRVAAEAEGFLVRQPDAAAFSQAVTRDLDVAVQKAALGLCFLLFKILEASLGRPFPALAEARIAAAAERVARADDLDPAVLADGSAGVAHGSLVPYILEVFYGGAAAPVAYDEAVRARFVLLLRTLTDALDLGDVEG